MRARRGGQLSAFDRLLGPPVAEGWNALLGALRSGTTLPPDLRELIILRVAVLNGAAFEWTAHEPIARRAGLDGRRLRDGVPVPGGAGGAAARRRGRRVTVTCPGDWTPHVTMDDGPRTDAGTFRKGLRAMRSEPPSPDPEVLPA